MDEQKTKQHTEAPEPIDLTALLGELWRIFTRMFWVPLVLAVLAGGLLGLRSWRGYTPMYRSEATFTVQLLSNQYDITGVDSYYDKAAAEQLANTFPYLLSSDLMQQLLQRELGVGWLNGSITAQSVANTNLFSVQVTSTSAQDAYDILNGVIAVYPQVANYVVGSTELTVLVPPAVASQPYNAFQPTRTIIKGAVLGFGVGVVFLLVLAMASKTIRTREDMKKWMNVPCLGTLPTVSFKRRTGKTGGTVTILNDRTGSAFQESIRSLRIRFLREAERQESKVFLVSSTVPGEGKTTVAVNLALTLGQNGARVILVDMDLRKPSVKKALGLTAPSKGVPELLRGGEESPKAALMELEGTRVRVLAGDKAVENPRRQLESRKLSGLIKALREEADYVVIDTPPNGLLGDSTAMATLADGILYVVRAGKAQVPHIMDSIQLLSSSRTPLMGCVLNGVKENGGGYGYGHGYGYGGYRGYERHSRKSGRDGQLEEERK
ncbi:chain length determinant protein [Pseudoflavonifractor capillosus ATCC 29799]|uniref:Chain length determinant protein n=1 Tax=Pseudoflavonifractor capillosus ATCC 29799 TaxID=411467 RepID=A6NPR4_9FIRM|nr:polysaccharide biosynthesis tyrosine autokinase [Pseudoflavonifractor capillosus]EDN01839.1 chain length determinant protein [Pseudoflavonifractor capillosus ATCC 29799]